MGPAPAVAAVRRAVRVRLADLPRDALVVAACSGGPDSLALADGLAFEAPRTGLRAAGVTVDHGLQRGSAERADTVVRAMRELGLDPAESVRVHVGVVGGPEAAAREARYAALDAAAERLGAAAILLGHTLDDQAETVLLGLARGSGARSLAGMPAASGRYLRPFLGLPRSTTRAACRARGLEPWDDPQNADPSFARARVRYDALPVLERTLGPGVADALARSARLLRDDADALDAWAERAGEAARDAEDPVEESLDVKVLAELPAAVRRRVLRRAALAAGCPAGSLGAVHLAAAEALVLRWRGQKGVDLPGGVSVLRRCGRLAFRREWPRK
ncbi:MAG: tRNA lysidine(34) synthetase TilS [Streptosporangiaceae bacterium]